MSQTKAQLLDGKSATIQFTGGSASAPSVSFTGDTNTGIYSPGADQVAISTGGSGRLFVDASGRLLVGNSTTTNVSGFNGSFQLQGTNFDTATIAVTNVAANNTGSYLVLGKARGGTLGGYTSVNNGDNLGQIRFMGADGTGYVEAAYVGVTCNGVPGTNNMPGRLFFSTNSGTSSVTERMCITPSGLVGVGTSSPGQLLDVAGIARFGGSTTKLTTYSDSTYAGFFNGSSLTSNEALYMGAGNTFFYNNGSPSVTITSSGRVGVGTTSPSGPLAVVSDSGGLCARLQGRAGDSIGTLQFRDNADTATQGYIQGRSTGLRIGTSSGNPLIFLNDSTEQMRLDSSGRLGIGTSSPGTYLSIAATATDPTGLEGSAAFSINSNQTPKFQFGVGTSTIGYSAWIQNSVGNTNYPLSLQPRGGNVGIGTTTVNAKLEVAGGNIRLDNNQGVEWGGSNNYIYGNETTDFVAIATNGNERCRLDSSGRLLVGTSSVSANTTLLLQGYNGTETNAGGHLRLAIPTATPIDGANLGLVIFSDSEHTNCAIIRADREAGTWSSASKPTCLKFSTTKDGQASPTEAGRIDSSQRLLVGTTTPRGRITSEPAAGDWGLGINDISAGTQSFTAFRYSGTLIGSITGNNTATAYNTSSDYRLKENVTPVTDGITRLQQLKPSRFNFIADPAKTVDGFIAHEVQAVIPEAITGEKDAVDADGNPIYQGIDQSKLVPLLTAALQEAVAKIESLEARLTAAGI